jgi:hypothetical protein
MALYIGMQNQISQKSVQRNSEINLLKMRTWILFKDLVRTTQYTLSVSVIKISHLVALHVDILYQISQKSVKIMEINSVRTGVQLNYI